MGKNPESTKKSLGMSRRDFVQASVAGAGAAALASSIAPQAQARGTSPNGAPAYGDDVLWLLNRITMGYSRPEAELAHRLGYDAYLEYQLDHLNIDDSVMDERLTEFDTLDYSNAELYRRYRNNPDRPRNQLKKAMILRSVMSKRQLFERMVEFWTDHFTIFHDKELCQLFKTADDRDVIRAHALGKFPDMLKASAQSSAMQFYLDNTLNHKDAPNENYAREIMELHTLGVDGPYEEHDVKNVARCFTGWRIQDNDEPEPGEFIFDDFIHDRNQKVVLGHIIPPGGGIIDGEMVLDILASHPKTADFVSRKMCRWLLGYQPDEAIVQATKSAYLRTGGSIKDMIRVIFNRQSMQWQKSLSQDPWAELKFRRPYHAVVSILRAIEPRIGTSGPRYILDYLDMMEQVPYNKQTPDGYPDTAADWESALLPRWKFFADLLDGKVRTVYIDPDLILSRMGIDPSELGHSSSLQPRRVAQGVNRLLMGGAMKPNKVALIQQFIEESSKGTAGPDWTVIREAISLAASSPSYGYY